ncbi:MAG: hypothetical protein AAGE84_10165 [Cyanobacteria bacterium P01_G01_bin.39]
MTSSKKADSKNQSWNSQDLVKLSQNLGEAYLPGLDYGKSEEKTASLTVNKLIEMNKNRGSEEG